MKLERPFRPIVQAINFDSKNGKIGKIVRHRNPCISETSILINSSVIVHFIYANRTDTVSRCYFAVS
ncbi:hypothetical protein D3C75_1367960 [compost metagenome]